MPISVFSQYRIEGTIIDNNSNPVEYAEILLLTQDTIAIVSELSNANGQFSISVVAGNYLFQVRNFSKVFLTQNIALTKNISLDKIKIDNSFQLTEITVEYKKKLIERKVDRLIFNVENTVTAMGGDALDALKITPNIRVQNDQISMVGKSGLSVMVDDRLMLLSGDDLINFLKTIKSDDIKNIEVITNPPSKYDAEGNSGIVNIKLKKARKNSFSGNFRTSFTQATYSSVNIGNGLNYQKNKLTITSSFNYSNGNTAPYQEYTIYYPEYTWFEVNRKTNYQNSFSNRIALDYQISKKTIIGTQYTGAFSRPTRNGINTSYITNTSSNRLDSLIVTPSYLEFGRKTHSLNFYSITKLDTTGKQITVDVDYFGFKSNIDNNFNSNSYFSNGTIIPNRSLVANNLSYQNVFIYSSKIDVEIPLKWINLNFGGKISFIENDSKVSYFNKTNQPPVFDPTKSNLFNYKENTQALYLSSNKNLSKKTDIQVGLRFESTQTKGYSATLNQTNMNNYIKVFPTFYITYKIHDNSILALNGNRRIDRPSYRNLNPFRFYSSAYNYSEGNPFLQPYYTNNIDISHTYNNLYSSLYLYSMTNGIDQVTFVTQNNPSQVVTPYNFYTQKSIGFIESYTLNKWDWWESNNRLNFYYSKTYSNLIGTVPQISSWTTSFNSNNSISLNKSNTIKAELNFSYSSPSIAGSYNMASFYYIDAGIKMSLLKKKLQLTLDALDIFKSYKQIFTQNINGILTKSYDYSDTQKIRILLNFNFGKTLKIENREQSNKKERARI